MTPEPRDASQPLHPTANEPPVDPRKPPTNLEPKSHTTGGRKDHALPGEGEKQ